MKNIYEVGITNRIVYGNIVSTNILSDPVNNEKYYNDQNIQIKNTDGFPQYKVNISNELELRTDVDTNTDDVTIQQYKVQKRAELFNLINGNWIEILLHRTLGQEPDKTPTEALTAIINQWQNLKTASAGWTTKEEVDTAFTNALSWLGID